MEIKKETIVEVPVVPPVTPPVITETEDEKKIKQLEKEKADLIVEAANYKVAFLKEKSKKEIDLEETDEERIKRITLETINSTKIAQIDTEKETLLKKLAQENKELKLAQLNKTPPPAIIGSHNEGQKVTDTSVTPEQLAAFQAKGWTDKDIERYKKNLQKFGGR